MKMTNLSKEEIIELMQSKSLEAARQCDTALVQAKKCKEEGDVPAAEYWTKQCEQYGFLQTQLQALIVEIFK